ncbi:MAG TPA: hypothetical protein VFB41_02315 [Solirubrobacteraceae bacterium]|nr:hypothetical protein [Solirubrobacteraceae bacterium]
MILEAMSREGWQVLRGLPTTYGSVACLLTGPGGAFAVEARTQPGLGRLATVPAAWLRQASAQAEAAERWLGSSVTPLLVLRHAELDRSGAERDGVTVVTANDLPRYLRTAARAFVAA